VLGAARALEPIDIVAVMGQDAEIVPQAAGTKVVHLTQAEQVDAAHAVRQAGLALQGRAETLLVAPGDIPLIRPETLRKMVAQHRTEGAVVTMLTLGGATAEEAFSGVVCFREEWLWPNLDRLARRSNGEVTLADLVVLARDQGESVASLPVDDPLELASVGERLGLARAEAEMRRRINERWMIAGVTLVHPEMTYIEAGVEIGVETVIWPNTLLQGGTRVGQRCTIGPGSIIRDSTIGDGCRVELSVVEQAIMEEGSDVGPFGHLRKGAHLGPGAHMGNFGEVKNSYLGPGVKMGHMSYLGDATVGAGVNIGAGTITCNYDGQRKHRTRIGEGAFIGSDTMLVAPVEIGDGAKTGAGSVVTRDVPPGSVAYGVPARIRATPASPLPAPVPSSAEGGTAGERDESEVE
jgi:bifunctional UDP-N-acetylglucosamine pyrophosphorylase/glucosamine-1-phosphate N-acetyltransferase